MNVRKAHLSDLPSVYEICHRTGFEGQDASAVVSDRHLLGHYFAAPYVVHNSEWCWIAADEQGVAGYLVATPDTLEFVEYMNSDWLPAVRGLYPTQEDSSWSSTERWIRQTILRPATVPPITVDYPAHLHIDFLPRAQGQGLGTRLIDAFLAQLRAQNIVGFHLGVGAGNTRAQQFYAKQGFATIQQDPGVVWMGLKV